MDIERINRRVDSALEANRGAERIVLTMSAGIFAVGIGVLLVSYWSQNAYVAGGAALLEGFLYWPIREVLRLRKDNVALQVLPSVVAELPPKEAEAELVNFLKFLRGESP